MAKGAKSLQYKDMLNGIEESQPGAKHQFLVGFLKQGRQTLQVAPIPDLRECVRCGQPTTATLCSFCRMADRGRKKVAQKEAKYGA